MSIPAIVVLILLAWFMLELLGLLSVGKGVIMGAARWLRTKRNSSMVIEMPDDVAVAVANGLIVVGSEIIAGSESEWDGLHIKHHAISSEILKVEPGTRMKVIRIGKGTLELRMV